MIVNADLGSDEDIAVPESDDDDDESIKTTVVSSSTTAITSSGDDDDDDDDENNVHRKQMERVWRYNKKPLLSIGAQKGPTIKHGNSLRELLLHHTTVKVKIQLLFNASNRNSDTQSIQDQMVQVYEQLKEYTVQYNASLQDMELLQVRTNERILLVGLPGTKQKIIDKTYPPPPPPPRVVEDKTPTTTTTDI